MCVKKYYFKFTIMCTNIKVINIIKNILSILKILYMAMTMATEADVFDDKAQLIEKILLFGSYCDIHKYDDIFHIAYFKRVAPLIILDNLSKYLQSQSWDYLETLYKYLHIHNAHFEDTLLQIIHTNNTQQAIAALHDIKTQSIPEIDVTAQIKREIDSFKHIAPLVWEIATIIVGDRDLYSREFHEYDISQYFYDVLNTYDHLYYIAYGGEYGLQDIDDDKDILIYLLNHNNEYLYTLYLYLKIPEFESDINIRINHIISTSDTYQAKLFLESILGG